MKPVALVERAIRNSSKSRDIVLDPFGGSGSTLIACEKTGRQARLVELDPKYCDVIVQRWQDWAGRGRGAGGRRAELRTRSLEREAGRPECGPCSCTPARRRDHAVADLPRVLTAPSRNRLRDRSSRSYEAMPLQGRPVHANAVTGPAFALHGLLEEPRQTSSAATLRLWPEIGADPRSGPEVGHRANHLDRHGRLLAAQLRCPEVPTAFAQLLAALNHRLSQDWACQLPRSSA